jgi:hypothetical protein
MIGERLLPSFNFLFVGSLAITAAIRAICCGVFCAQLARADSARVGSRDYISRKRELSRLAGNWRSKVRQRHADEPNAFGRREYRSDQAKSELMQLLPRLDRHLRRSAAGGNLKVGPFDLHRDGPATGVHFLAPGPHVVSHRDDAGLDLSRISQVLRESGLRPRRLSFSVRLNEPVVPTSRDVVVPTPSLPEVLLQERGFDLANPRPSRCQGRSS